MKLTITIELETPPTSDLTMGELRVILLPVPRKVWQGEAVFSLLDSYGNTVGGVKVEP